MAQDGSVGSTKRLMLAAAAVAALAAPAPTVSATPAAASVQPQDARFAADFDAFLRAAMRRLPTMTGLSVAVARGSGPVFARGYGEADREHHVPATADTRFYIASSTKSFVALAFASLAAKKRINLDWTLAELAPDIAFAPEVRAGEVTLRHLLSHSHGLTEQGIEFRLAYSGEHDPATLWRLLAHLRANPKAPLGTFAYSNLGYNVAAILVEHRLHRRWQDLLDEEVLRPMRLRETLAQGLGAAHAPLALPYAGLAPGGPALLPLAKTDATLQSAGGIYSSANDMGRWIALQLAAEQGRAGLPLPAVTVAATHAPIARMDQSFGPFARKGYGLGWYSGPYRGETLYHSFGGFVGARAHASFLPARDIGVSIQANDEDIGFLFVDVAAAYVYDWHLLGRDAAERNAEEAVARLAALATKQAEAKAADLAKRRARTWRLSLPVQAYRGRYCNEELGTLQIGGRGDTIEARIGVLHAIAEPFTAPDSARVELVPDSGQSLHFVIRDRRVTAVRTMDSEFARC